MKPISRLDMFDHAERVLKINDMGTYTVPTHGLYPFQWNWDSCLTALGQAHFDEHRAWTEIDTLFQHQWEDGMVPHIVFHKQDKGYFPGPDVWQTGRTVPTSGITQPPVAGYVVKRLVDHARDPDLAEARARDLVPKIARWHEWFHACRDPKKTGLVAILHPWESGRDNSIDWDDAFSRVPTDGVGEFKRRDTSHADAAHRPTDEQYKRYIWLVQRFRSLNWDNTRLHDASPFQVVDPGFNAILIRSVADIAELAERYGMTGIAQMSRRHVAEGLAALESLWDDRLGQYVCFDRPAGRKVDSASIGGILPVFAAIPLERVQQLATRIEALKARVEYLIPSHDPADPRFESLRYWRGPVWLIINHMIIDGLVRGDVPDLIARITSDSIRLIEEGGFAEYHDPLTAEPCGGGTFSWTAAMIMEFLQIVEPVRAGS
ncbi:MGH1-like glycoside hydrolase domain-containing protein [Rhizobium halophytocola]|uniref:Glycogen debranching enzyme n=1 Tax=Rhizobium halophytocola TaxID=735519 RepID=A0ABS4DU03_9HYPH|nr:trehalase family glycosidase [Rhizobium halophytocola]MBP1849159.1 glycogen debranching enzyme [Rhizobium halophytocola]